MTDRRISPPSTILGVLRAKFLGLGCDEDGAALVITLAIFFLMYLGCMGVYAVSMAVKERIQLQNAADAAVYSAAVVQADTLSRIATINRAMSWTYVQMTRRQMDYIQLKWLRHAFEHYKLDLETAREYNRGGVLGPPCGEHGSCGVGWYIGANADINTMGQMQLNGYNTSFIGSFPGNSMTGLIGIGGKVVCTNLQQTAGQVLTLDDVLKEAEEHVMLGLVQSGDFAAPKDVDGVKAAVNQAGSIISAAFDSSHYSPSNNETANSVRGMLTGLYANDETTAQWCLKAQIAFDRINIASMNIYSRFLALDLPGRISKTVEDVVRANVPEYMQEDCLYLLVQNANPIDGEDLRGPLRVKADGYFGNLRNGKNGEQRLLSFAGYDSDLYDVYLKGAPPLFTGAGGVNQWFVRGDGNGRTDGRVGIQRSYKHWSEGPLENMHMAHNPLVPSCWNNKKLEGAPVSIALHAEWQWWSDVWSCPHILIVPLHLNPMIHKSKFWPVKIYCDHNDKPGFFGFKDVADTFKSYKSLSVKDLVEFASSIVSSGLSTSRMRKKIRRMVDEKMKDAGFNKDWDSVLNGADEDTVIQASGGEIDEYEDGCLVYPDLMAYEPGHPSRAIPLTGYSRLYADDKHIYNSCYVGENAKPLILEKEYFGKAGTISVGIRRKNENVFLRILKKIEGIFTAFDPDWNDGEDTHTYVFASAKAGYKDKGEDADSRQYKIDWQPNNQDWNLCQSDWDAVFVPVRKAYSYAISGMWFDGDDDMLFDWVVSRADEWKPVAGKGGEDYMSRNVYAPRGVLRGNGHDGKLKWRELSHVVFH